MTGATCRVAQLLKNSVRGPQLTAPCNPLTLTDPGSEARAFSAVQIYKTNVRSNPSSGTSSASAPASGNNLPYPPSAIRNTVWSNSCLGFASNTASGPKISKAKILSSHNNFSLNSESRFRQRHRAENHQSFVPSLVDVAHSQKYVLTASTTRYSSSTTRIERHLSKAVQGCEMPLPMRSPTSSFNSVGNER